MQNSLSRQIILSILGIAILIIAVVGISYAVFVTTLTGTKENEITTGTISMSFVEENDGISISNAMPMSNKVGKKLDGAGNTYDFVVSSTIAGITTVNYEIVAEKLPFSDYESLSDENIRIYLQKKDNDIFVDVPITSVPTSFRADGQVSILGSPAEGMILYKGSFENNTTEKKSFSDYFRLRMWVSDNTILDNIVRKYKLKINVYGKVL